MKNQSITIFAKYYFYALVFSPFLSFLIKELIGIEPNYFYRIFTFLVLFEILVIKQSSLKFPKILYLLILYIVFLFIWDLNNFVNDRADVFEIVRKPYFETITFILIIENTIFTKKYINHIVFFLKATIIVAAIFTFIQFVFNPQFFLPNDSFFLKLDFNSIYNIRRTSVFGYVDENAIGLSFLPIIAIFFSWSLINKSKNIVGFLILAAFVVIGSNSRYVIVGYLIVMVMYLFQKRVKPLLIFKFALSGFLVVTSTIFILQFFGYDLYDFYLNRIFPEQSIEKSTRYLALQAFSSFFNENLIFGTGVHLTTEIIRYLGGVSSQIHVGYLAHLVSYGIIGSIFLFGFWFSISRNFYRTARLSGYYGSFFAFLIFLWANATLVFYPIFTYGLIIAFMFDKYHKDLIKNNVV